MSATSERGGAQFMLEVWLEPLPPDVESEGPIIFGPFERVAISRHGHLQVNGWSLAIAHDQGEGDLAVRITNRSLDIQGLPRLWNRNIDCIEIHAKFPEVPLA